MISRPVVFLLLIVTFFSCQAFSQQHYVVQIGAFQKKCNANEVKERLTHLIPVHITKVKVGNKNYYTAVTAQIANHTAAQKLQHKINQKLHISSKLIASPTICSVNTPLTKKVKTLKQAIPTRIKPEFVPVHVLEPASAPNYLPIRQNERIYENCPIAAFNDPCCLTPCPKPCTMKRQSGFYAALAGGSATSQVTLTKLDPGIPPRFFLVGEPKIKATTWIISPAVGFDFYERSCLPWRTEFAYSNTGRFFTTMGSGLSERKFRYYSQVYLWNNYLDMHYFKRVIPFIGAGIGISRNVGATSHPVPPNGAPIEFGKKIRTNFSWSGSAGINIVITNHLRLTPFVEYIDLKEMRFGQIDGPAESFPVRANRSEFYSHLYMINYKLQLAYYF